MSIVLQFSFLFDRYDDVNVVNLPWMFCHVFTIQWLSANPSLTHLLMVNLFINRVMWWEWDSTNNNLLGEEYWWICILQDMSDITTSQQRSIQHNSERIATHCSPRKVQNGEVIIAPNLSSLWSWLRLLCATTDCFFYHVRIFFYFFVSYNCLFYQLNT